MQLKALALSSLIAGAALGLPCHALAQGGRAEQAKAPKQGSKDSKQGSKDSKQDSKDSKQDSKDSKQDSKDSKKPPKAPAVGPVRPSPFKGTKAPKREETPDIPLEGRSAAERFRNERCYKQAWLPQQAAMHAKHRGRWIAIVAGKVFPRMQRGSRDRWPTSKNSTANVKRHTLSHGTASSFASAKRATKTSASACASSTASSAAGSFAASPRSG